MMDGGLDFTNTYLVATEPESNKTVMVTQRRTVNEEYCPDDINLYKREEYRYRYRTHYTATVVLKLNKGGHFYGERQD